MARFCERCLHDINGDCEIIALSMAFDVSNPEYPKEWIYGDDNKPTCTAFEDAHG